MDINQVKEIVTNTIREYCQLNEIEVAELNEYTPLIGRESILDSIGLVNVIVDIETAFLDEDIEVSLTSDAAMSARISPFRTIGALSHFIARQIGVEE